MIKALLTLVLFTLSCTPHYIRVQDQGFNKFRNAFNSIESEGEFHTVIELKKVRVHIVSHRKYFEWDKAAAYASPIFGYATRKNEIYVFGRRVNGKIVVNQAILGHELNHLLNFRNPKIANPDKLDDLFE